MMIQIIAVFELFFSLLFWRVFIMQNNKLHFKMYKSGKNWMTAGVVSTAVLAGLTLGSVNNNVTAHADAQQPVAQTKATVDQKAKTTTGTDANGDPVTTTTKSTQSGNQVTTTTTTTTEVGRAAANKQANICLLYTSPSPRDRG